MSGFVASALRCIGTPYLGWTVVRPTAEAYRAYRAADYWASSPSVNPDLTAKWTPFFEKHGLCKNVVIVNSTNKEVIPGVGKISSLAPFIADGMLLGRRKTVIAVPVWLQQDVDACSGLIKHEACHAKDNMTGVAKIATTVSTVASTLLSLYTWGLLPAIIIGPYVRAWTEAAVMRYYEAKADDFAIANSSDDELKGIRRIFKLYELIFKEMDKKQGYFGQIKRACIDPYHPSLTSRIEKVEKALQQRKIQIDETEEWEKMKRLGAALSDSQQ